MIAINRIEKRMTVFAESVKEWFKREKMNLYFCFIVTFIFGLAAHAFAFFNSDYSHDSLNAIFASQSELNWKLELGRFLVPLYQCFFRGRFALPWLIGFLSLVYMSVALYLVQRLFDLKSRVAVALIAGIMATNITMIAQVGSYIHELDCNMLSLLFAVTAVFFWRKLKGVKSVLLAVIFMFLSMGIYQSYTSAALTLIVFELFFALLDGEKLKSTILRGLKGVGIVLCSFFMYDRCSKWACAREGIKLRGRVELFAIDESENIVTYYLKLIKDAYVDYFDNLMNTSVYGRIIVYLVTVLAVMFAFVIVYRVVKQREIKWYNKLFALVIVALMPMLINSTFIIARGFSHDIVIYSIWLTFALFVLAAYKLPDVNVKSVIKSTVTAICAVLVSVLLWQNVVIANTLYLKKNIEAKSTMATMTRVISEMEDFEGYVMGETPVAFIGTDNPFGTIDGFGQVRNITGAWSSSSIRQDTATYYYNTYSAYFKYVLNYPVNMCSEKTKKELDKDAYVDKMPSFPEKGFIEMIDGVMVVKLG